MHCNRTTRNKLAEIQDKATGLTPLELRQVGELAEQVAAGIEIFSARSARVVDAVHRLRVQGSTLVDTPGEQPTLFDYDCGGRRCEAHTDAVTHDGGPDKVDGAPSDGDTSAAADADAEFEAAAKRKAAKAKRKAK
jgi:hypothetical protein